MTATGEWLEVESLDLEAQGVAHRPPEGDAAVGKVVFIEGALPGDANLHYLLLRTAVVLARAAARLILPATGRLPLPAARTTAASVVGFFVFSANRAPRGRGTTIIEGERSA